MAIHVYHNPHFPDFANRAGPETLDLHSLYLAAIVDTDDPAQAYRLTQHVDGAGYDQPAVTVVARSRFTSVGDVLATAGGRLLLVAPFGFRELCGCSLPAGLTARAGGGGP